MGINQLNITQDSSGVQRVISVSNSGSGEAVYIQQFAPNAAVTALKVEMPSVVNNEPVICIRSSASNSDNACAVQITHKTNTVGLQIITDGVGALDAPLIIVGSNLQITNSKTPTSSTDGGKPGQICWDANFIYVCIAPNIWKRATLNTW